MYFPQLKIDQQFAKIGLDIKPSDFKVDQGKSNLQIIQEMGKLKLKSDIVEIKVNNYPAEYDLGYRNPGDAGKEFAQKGKEAYRQYLSKTSRDGDRLMRIEENTTITDLAVETTYSAPGELSLKWKRGPEIDVTKNNLEIDYQPQKPIFKSQINFTKVDLDWGKVNTRVKQYQDIDISLIGNSLNNLV